MNEHFEKWTPIPECDGTLWVEALHDDWEGFRVVLSREAPSHGRIRLFFGFPLAYRNTNEGNLLRLWDDAADQRGLGKHSLYLVSNSPFVEWFHVESVGVHRGKAISHYAIMTPEDCIDVLSLEPPKIELLSA